MSWYSTNPTVRDYPSFNAVEDAEALRKAMKGLGTDEQAIINILCARTNKQRQAINTAFTNTFNRDLISDLKSELGGHFEDIIIALMLPSIDYLAKQLNKALNGFTNDATAIIEILCTRSKSEIKELNELYEKMFDRPMVEHICSQTSGDFRKLLTFLATGVRENPGQVTPSKAVELAQALYDAGEKQLGTKEEVFVRIFTHQSFEQLRLVFEEYKKIAGKTIEQSLKSEMSGTLLNSLLTIVEWAQSPTVYFAKHIQQAMAGLGTDDTTLIRIIVSRSEIDLGEIKKEYEKIYDKTLESQVKGETSGDYKRALLALIGGP